jgi:hypothetical protein
MCEFNFNFSVFISVLRSRNGSVGIASYYRLNGPGIESRLGARFSAPVQTGSEAHPTSYSMGTGSFPRVNRPGRGVGHQPLSSAEVKERVELYVFFPLGLRGCYRVKFTWLYKCSSVRRKH